jgi:hypothetical protein
MKSYIHLMIGILVWRLYNIGLALRLVEMRDEPALIALQLFFNRSVWIPVNKLDSGLMV